MIGAGVAGLAAGYFLSEQAKVVVLEQEEQPAYHSTGRSAALYIEGYENPVVAGLTAQSGDFFRTQHERATVVARSRGISYRGRGSRTCPLNYLSIWQPFCPNLKPLTAAECRLICPILTTKADWRSLRPRLEIHRYPRTDQIYSAACGTIKARSRLDRR